MMLGIQNWIEAILMFFSWWSGHGPTVLDVPRIHYIMTQRSAWRAQDFRI